MKPFLFAIFVFSISAMTALAALNPTNSKANDRNPSLESQLQNLDVANKLPEGANREKLYSVQQRYLPLTGKSEFSFGGALDLTPDSFLTTEQLDLSYRFHFSDRWAVELGQAWVDNNLKSEAGDLKNNNGAIPAVPFASSRTDLMAEYSLFYGKFRWGPDSVSYFDMYAGLGPGFVRQNTGTVGAGVADLGFAFWLGRWGSLRLGLKDFAYNETYRTQVKLQNNVHAHMDLGILF